MNMSWGFIAYTGILAGIHVIILQLVFLDTGERLEQPKTDVKTSNEDAKKAFMWFFLAYVPLYLRGFGLI